MKHIFIMNPCAGNGSYMDELNKKLGRLNGADIEVYVTKAPRDATEYVHNWCEKYNQPVRFYACGGDGTIKEVVDGIIGYPFAELSCYPCGSGNDFVKYYGGKSTFSDLERLVNSKSAPIDLIKIGNQYSINIVNFGFDTTVARTMAKVKNKKLIGGKNAYKTGILTALFTAMKNHAYIYIDGEKVNDGNFLLCTVANGQYVGGAYKCAPKSKNDDGYIDVCMVKCIPQMSFFKLVKSYKTGNYLDDPKFKDIIVYKRARSVSVKAQDGFAISVDGEIVELTDFIAEVLPSAIRFAAPITDIAFKTEEISTVTHKSV